MSLWRISNYADLDGAGGVLFPGRWHNAGRPIIYAAESPAGALLEILVHLDREDLPDDYQLIEIAGPETASIETIDPRSLPARWRDDLTVTRSIGDQWLRAARSLLLRVPSVLAPRTWNYLFNPRHADASAARIATTERFPFDGRLK